MDWNGYISALTTYAELSSSDANFLNAINTIVAGAELRCYRDLNLTSTNFLDTGGNVTANSRLFNLPSTYGRFIEVNSLIIFTPVGTTTTGNVVTPTTVDTINTFWPSETAPLATTVPKLFARFDDAQLLLGPPPGAAFTAGVIGTVRPTPISSTNTTTFLSLYVYDLFFAASMVEISAYMKDFGAMAEDPKIALSWEAKYQTALAGAQREELRKKFVTPPTVERK